MVDILSGPMVVSGSVGRAVKARPAFGPAWERRRARSLGPRFCNTWGRGSAINKVKIQDRILTLQGCIFTKVKIRPYFVNMFFSMGARNFLEFQETDSV